MVESFNGRLRQECLNEHWFMSLQDARNKIEAWRGFYNEERPHSALDAKRVRSEERVKTLSSEQQGAGFTNF
jgi:transposase InsO family protein